MEMTVLSEIYVYIISFIPHYVGINRPGLPLMSVSRFYIIFWLFIFYLNFIVTKNKNLNKKLSNIKNEQYPFIIPYVVLSISLLLVSIFSNDIGISVQAWIALLSESLIPSYLIWISFYNSDEIIKVFKTIIISFVLIAIYGIISDHLSFNPVINYVQTHFENDSRTLVITYDNYMRLGVSGRSQSIFYHPLQYSCFLCFILCILFQLNKHMLAFDKKSTVIFLLVFIYSLLLVRSRSPIVFLLVAGFMYLFILKSVKTIWTISLAVMLIIIFLYFQNRIFDNAYVTLLISIFQEFIGHESLVRGSSLIDRIYKFNATFDIFSIHPLLGHGLGSMRSMVFSAKYGINGAESFVFELLIESGLIGVFAYVFFYTFLIKYFWNFSKFSTDLLFTKFSILSIALILGYLSFIIVTGRMNTFNYFIVLITLTAKYLSCKSKENNILEVENPSPLNDPLFKTLSLTKV
jgi:O-antigen ligase